jgi:hypothetical protein
MDVDAPARIATDPPLIPASRDYSGEAAIPEYPHLEGTGTPPRRQDRFVVDLSACVVRSELRNGVGLSPVSVASHCEQVTPPSTLRDEGNSRDALPRGTPSLDGRPPDASAGYGAWHHRLSRNATPPVLSLPGPFVAARCRTTLAAYLPIRKFEQGFLDRHGPAQVGLTPPFGETHRLRLS